MESSKNSETCIDSFRDVFNSKILHVLPIRLNITLSKVSFNPLFTLSDIPHINFGFIKAGFNFKRKEHIFSDATTNLSPPGMKGQVMSLHDGFHMDLVQGGSVPPKALVEFESGERLLVDKRMKWRKVSKP